MDKVKVAQELVKIAKELTAGVGFGKTTEAELLHHINVTRSLRELAYDMDANSIFEAIISAGKQGNLKSMLRTHKITMRDMNNWMKLDKKING